jgi:16S rRNA (cytidine1402-2'-O)-methyltransferase
MSGTLYIVATPIGNLEDITLRAIRILKEVDLILAEDTRVTKKLLTHYVIERPIASYHQHSSEKRKLEILQRLGKEESVALVTDAGTPGVSDPGNELIDFLLGKDSSIKIVPIPGASAITTAMSVSGFKMSKFLFLGFLPKRKKNKLFQWVKDGKVAFGFYESPKRIIKTLDFLGEQLGGDRRVLIAREMTKLHETLYRGRISTIKEQLEEGRIKGEIVVIVER